MGRLYIVAAESKHKMLLRYIFFTIVFLFSAAVVRSEESIKILTMSETELDTLIRSEKGPCLITVTASWCAPCISELPELIKLYDKYKNRGLKLVGLSVDFGGPSPMQPIADRLKVNFPIYWVGEKAIYTYKIDAIPILFFIREGKIVEKIVGQRSPDFLDKQIEAFLK